MAPVQSWEDNQLAILRPVATINTDSPEHLIEEIRQQEQAES